MKKRSVWMIFLCGFVPALAFGCIESGGGGSGGGGGQGGQGGSGQGGSGQGGNSGTLQWYTTCGDPVCSMYMMKPGVTLCTTEMEGAACTSAGQECDPVNDCNALLRCATSDPKDQPGGCPISRARHKTDIDYLDERELASVSEELLSMRLATWRYKAESPSTRPHLGFMIDDNPDSPSVARTGEQVDLYGYTSMAVAAVQMQAGRMEAMEREMKALREEVLTLRQRPDRCEPSR
jgi:hypothetical protein